MNTPFDDVIRDILARGYHNQRRQDHSDIVSTGIFKDLIDLCPSLKADIDQEKVKHWINVKTPGGRGRRIDLFIGEPSTDGRPDLSKIRVAVENKSVVTAHRNKTNRSSDLSDTLLAIQDIKPDAVVVATVIIGLATRYLNVCDNYKKWFKRNPEKFELVRPRLSTGDATLWEEFDAWISDNEPDDPQKTLKEMRKLRLRNLAFTHERGFDALLCVPMMIDNVNPPTIPQPNPLGIDVATGYRKLIEDICRAYTIRWHS